MLEKALEKSHIFKVFTLDFFYAKKCVAVHKVAILFAVTKKMDWRSNCSNSISIEFFVMYTASDFCHKVRHGILILVISANDSTSI